MLQYRNNSLTVLCISVPDNTISQTDLLKIICSAIPAFLKKVRNIIVQCFKGLIHMKGRTVFFMVFIMAAMLSASSQENAIPQSGFRSGHPADFLPPYIKMVSGFGERPDWSHDGKRILFVDKPMGEVYELELATGIIRPKTRHFNHYGFTRALYLSNGDILLSGPDKQFDALDPADRDRARDMCWLSVLDKDGDKNPVPLHTLCAEGPAVSRNKMVIAWTHRGRQFPEMGTNHARILMAEIAYENGIPHLDSQRVVFDSHRLPFNLGNASLETQNFVPPEDTKLIFSVYTIDNGNNTDAYIIDTKTGEFQNLTKSPCCYDEPEGIFPDGLYTCVEHGPSAQSAWPLVDLFKLKLDGSGEMQRLTYFSDFKNYKGTQGVVSDDGKFLCFQIGKSNDEAGVGYGFFVMDLQSAADHLEPFRSYSEGDHRLQIIADEFETAWNHHQPLPAIRELYPEIAIEQAYNVQRAWVHKTKGEKGYIGVKGEHVRKYDQKQIAGKESIGATLRADSHLFAEHQPTIHLAEFTDLKLQTGIAFVISRSIDRKLTTVEDFIDHIGGIVPAITLISAEQQKTGNSPVAVDLAAKNLNLAGSITCEKVDPESIELGASSLSLTYNGQLLYESAVSDSCEDLWETGLWLAQYAHRQGVILEPGNVILCGSAGNFHRAKKGSYELNAGILGKIRFSVE
jgi:2-keto-4-pentenoate hydratase